MTSTTERVQRAARKAALAREELHAAIRDARDAGVSLRAVAEAAGMSHEQVRRINRFVPGAEWTKL